MEHEEKAERMEEDAEHMEEHSDQLGERIDDIQGDWRLPHFPQSFLQAGAVAAGQ